MAVYLTLSPENQFQFTCPIFNARTKMASCMVLRERVWMGKATEKRRGCQVAMNCGMCPAAEIVSKISYSHGDTVSDDYGSIEPKAGRLHADILERVRNVVPLNSILDKSQIDANERQLLLTTRARIDEQLKTAPGRDGKNTSFVSPKKVDASVTYGSTPVTKRRRDETDLDMTITATIDRRQKTIPNTKLNQAAMTGDMAAAINAAA